MADYIEREAAIDATRKVSVGLINQTTGAWDLGFTNALRLACNSIAAIPAADVREVVSGRWVTRPYMMGQTEYCSRCGENYGRKHNFCPNCGADMREES